MNAVDVVLVILIAVALTGAVISCIRQRKKGRCCGCCDCGCCAHCQKKEQGGGRKGEVNNE